MDEADAWRLFSNPKQNDEHVEAPNYPVWLLFSFGCVTLVTPTRNPTAGETCRPILPEVSRLVFAFVFNEPLTWMFVIVDPSAWRMSFC